MMKNSVIWMVKLDFSIPVGSIPGTRREQLKNLMCEKFIKQYNSQTRQSDSSNSEESE